MTSCFASVMTVPISAVTTSVIVTLSTPFNYTGGGIYVAYDWYSPGPYATTNAIYLGETSNITFTWRRRRKFLLDFWLHPQR